jgi:hypothetical protein
MPKLVDVCNRLPEAQEAPKQMSMISNFVKEPQTWVEESGGWRITYTGDPHGAKFVVRTEWRPGG